MTYELPRLNNNKSLAAVTSRSFDQILPDPFWAGFLHRNGWNEIFNTNGIFSCWLDVIKQPFCFFVFFPHAHKPKFAF